MKKVFDELVRRLSKPVYQERDPILEIFTRMLFAIFISAVIGVMGAMVASSPGGLAGSIGNLYARICLSGGACVQSTLDGAFTLAVVILFGLLVWSLYAIADWADLQVTNADVYNLIVDLIEDVINNDDEDVKND